MLISKFSKKYNKFLKRVKLSFERDKSTLIDKQVRDAIFYSKEPLRGYCKNCQSQIDHDDIFLIKKISDDISIPYYLCATCGHLNGKYQDTENYSKKLYSGESAKYGEITYLKSTANFDDYQSRVKNIYFPKVKFFDEVTQLNKETTKIWDMGCGAGYLLESFKKLGFDRLMGTEIAPDLLNSARTFHPGIDILESSDSNVIDIIKSFDGNVICMIGVLEHLVYNSKVMDEIKKNRCIEYLFISVPKLSLSVYLELLSPDFFHRQLSSGHTHLYTDDSLRFFEQMYSLQRLGEWYFGADIEDLRRLIFSELGNFEKAKLYLEENFFKSRDELQKAIDKTRFTSEVHLVYRINR